MWFSRQGKTFRGWFQAISSTGQLRAGLGTGSFFVAVINPNDNDSFIPWVSESSQRPGNYYFDVPSPFFIANGTGDYNVSIEINTQLGNAGSPHVKWATSEVLAVNENDIDTISGSVANVGLIVSGVWNANSSAFNVSGSMGHLQNMTDEISASVTFTKDIEAGTWIVTGSQMIFYASGSNNELARFELQDIDGNTIDPATQNPFRRFRL